MVFLTISLLCASSVRGQSPAPVYTIEAKAGFDFSIVIPIRVNGKGPFSCAQDTGSNHVFSLSSEAAKKFDLNPGATGYSAGGAGAGVVADRRLTGATLTIGPVEVANRTVVIRDGPQGPSTDCILGTEILDAFVVEIDYETPAIRLYDPASYKPAPGAVSVPVSFDHGNPMIDAQLLLRAGETAKAHLMLDTGPSIWPVALWKRFADDNGILTRSHNVVKPPFGATGPAGAAALLATRADSVSVGPFTSQNPVVLLFRTESGSAVANGWDGLLGPEFIRRFTLTIDYPNQRLFLKVVGNVLPASAGASAGLKKGDILLTLDGIASPELTIYKIHEKLYRSSGRYALRVQRGDRQIEVTLELTPIGW